MSRVAMLAREAIGAAPREQAVVFIASAALVAAGMGLLGAAVYHALSAAAGAQVARFVLGAVAFALAGAVWAVGAARARHRRRVATFARARLAQEVGAAGLGRASMALPVAAFLGAFVFGRRH